MPPGVSFLHAKAWGGGGNQECTNGGSGGVGGFTEAVLAVTPGDPLVIIVGGRKMSTLNDLEKVMLGFPGIGAGGLSGVFQGPGPIDQTSGALALIIAGGGGGAALGTPCAHGNPGNHLTLAGTQADMLGANGTAGMNYRNSGGGGFKGGDAGSADDQAGKGGKQRVAPAALDSVVLWSEPGDLFPPRLTDPDYVGAAGVQEQRGRVVLHFLCEAPPPL